MRGINRVWFIKLMFVFSVLLCNISLLQAQTPASNADASKVNVDEISDEQVQSLIDEIEKRGWSESQAMSVARARGMSQSQIDLLKIRMEKMKSSKSKSSQTSISTNNVEVNSKNGFSSKVEIDNANVDGSVFGFQFFNNTNLSFEPNLTIPVSSTYIVGSGDEIQIDIWGISEQSYTLRVDRNGIVVIPQVGAISVGNLTLVEVQMRLTQQLSKIYSDLASSSPRTFANIYLSTLKAIKVNVIGEVFAPGTYTLPGTASVFNALYLCGGPNKMGSFRDIQVLRDGKKVASLDVYDFLINGNSSVNLPLRDNDVVLVPPYLKRVIIGGEFKRNGLFESKDGEFIADMIKYAGGFTENAYTNRIELYRNTSKQREFKNVGDSLFATLAVQNGDSIYAGIILDRFENKVSINGAVFRPGKYELTEGLTLKDLIAQADGLREDAFVERGLITRLNDDLSLGNLTFNVLDAANGKENINLKRDDIVTIRSKDDLREERTIQVAGEVKKPGVVVYQDNMTLADLIFKSGGLLESASQASIEISRRLSYDEAGKVGENIAEVFQMSIDRNLRIDKDDASFKLSPYDQVFIRRSPSFSDWGNVRITGEVTYAGDFSLSSKKERVSDVIKRSGGLTPFAFPRGAMLTRQVQVSSKILRLRKELVKKDSTLFFTDLEFEVVGIDLDKIMENQGSKYDIFMRPGDELNIPREMQTVKISGEVLNPLSVPYLNGGGIKKFINKGGGFSNRAKKKSIYVINANGVASSTKSYVLFRKYPKVSPGAEVVVPQKPDRQSIGAAGWISIASGLASIGLSIATIVNIGN